MLKVPNIVTTAFASASVKAVTTPAKAKRWTLGVHRTFATDTTSKVARRSAHVVVRVAGKAFSTILIVTAFAGLADAIDAITPTTSTARKAQALVNRCLVV